MIGYMTLIIAPALVLTVGGLKMKIEVTEEQFNQFINCYPNKLTRNCCGIFEPPQVQFHDFVAKEGWDSVVAYFYDDYLNGNKRRFFIIRED